MPAIDTNKLFSSNAVGATVQRERISWRLDAEHTIYRVEMCECYKVPVGVQTFPRYAKNSVHEDSSDDEEDPPTELLGPLQPLHLQILCEILSTGRQDIPDHRK